MIKNTNLQEAILDFPLDNPNAGFNFTQRLARENRWTETFTQRVVQQYRRFIILCVEAGHPVTPSDAVDQAWHLHLCYTDSYWNQLCRETLGFPLHHGPTQGGHSEREKFNDWYSKTLESYERIFEEKPPADIWPSAEIRFGKQNFQRIDCSTQLVISKKSVLLTTLGGLGFICSAGCVSSFASGVFDVLGWANSGGFWWVFGIAIFVLFLFRLARRKGRRRRPSSDNTEAGGGWWWFGGGCSSDSGCGDSGCGGGGCGGGGCGGGCGG